MNRVSQRWVISLLLLVTGIEFWKQVFTTTDIL